MSVVAVLVEMAAITGALLLVATLLFVDLDDLVAALGDRQRLRSIAPYLVVLLVVLLINRVARQAGPLLSWVIDWNITAWIEAMEGDLVVQVQGMATPRLTEYLSFMYLYGYAFLLIFPFVLYYALPDTRRFRELIVAFAANYMIGLLCYVLFVAYGPRNTLADVAPLLYEHNPLAQLVTREVNDHTNVFPSLHTSLSVTVFLLALRTRETYPIWTVVATVFAWSIVVATVYTGIHWVTDVIAGIVLAGISVAIGIRVTTGEWPTNPADLVGPRPVDQTR